MVKPSLQQTRNELIIRREYDSDSRPARRSESRPDRGIVRTFIEVLNQNHEVVMSMKMVNFVRTRD